MNLHKSINLIFNNNYNLVYFFKVGANNIGKNRILKIQLKNRNIIRNNIKINLFICHKNILQLIHKIKKTSNNYENEK